MGLLSKILGNEDKKAEAETKPDTVSIRDLEGTGGQAEAKDSAPAEPVGEARILEVLSEVYDPEIPIDIVNLGLIYGVDIQDGKVLVKMTMTAPGCPSSAQMAAEAKMLIEELPGIKEATIDIVWDPPWDPSRMSEDAKQSLGYV